jgi:hypothetical protein
MQLILILLFTVLEIPSYFKTFIKIILGLFLLLIILYRPSFINKNGSKISLGFLFNKKDFIANISAIDFNFHFFTNFYYKNKEANIVEFSTIMEVNKEVLFNYIYFTYSMSFDELINKTRVEYFVEIIKYFIFSLILFSLSIPGPNDKQRSKDCSKTRLKSHRTESRPCSES